MVTIFSVDIWSGHFFGMGHFNLLYNIRGWVSKNVMQCYIGWTAGPERQCLCYVMWTAHCGDGSLVRKLRKGNIFHDVDAFCFVKAEFKLRRRVRHLRSDIEKAVLIKHRLLWTKDRETDTIRKRTRLQKFQWYPVSRGWTGTTFGSVWRVDWNP